MIELLNEEIYNLRSLCEGKKSVVLWAVVEGNMGKAWVDSKDDPTIGNVLVADFCYLLGSIKDEKDEKDEIKVKELLDKCKGRIIVADSFLWISTIEKYYSYSLKKFKRYAIKREHDVFQEKLLNDYI